MERRFSSSPVKLVGGADGTRATGRTVRGYAAVYSSRSEQLQDKGTPFYEEIAPGAFDGADKGTVLALWNHNGDAVLARSQDGEGTLKLGTDSVGLWYEFEAPNTTVGNDLVELLRRGDVNASSFAFSVAPGGDSYATLKNGTRLRTIRKIAQLFDVSPVSSPAYKAASANVRSGQDAMPAAPAPSFTSHRIAQVTPKPKPAAGRSIFKAPRDARGFRPSIH